MRDRPFQVSDSGDGAKTSEQEISARGWGVGREGFNSSLPLPFFRFAFFPSLFISCPFQLSGCLKKASLCCILKHRTAATFTIKHGRDKTIVINKSGPQSKNSKAYISLTCALVENKENLHKKISPFCYYNWWSIILCQSNYFWWSII